MSISNLFRCFRIRYGWIHLPFLDVPNFRYFKIFYNLCPNLISLLFLCGVLLLELVCSFLDFLIEDTWKEIV